MKLSVVTPTPEVKGVIPVALLSGTFSERLGKAVQMGYDGVELVVARPAELDVKNIRGQLASLGLQVSAIGTVALTVIEKMTLLAPDPETCQRALDRIFDLLELASILEAPLVNIGGFRGRLSYVEEQSARDRLIDILRAISERASSHGVRIALEPLNRYETDIVNNVAEGLKLIDEVGHSYFGLVLDTFHMNMEEPSFVGSIRRSMDAGRLWHVHICDNNRFPPGGGHINFREIVETLSDIGYQGYLSAELSPIPDLDAAAAATIEHMRQLL